MTTPARERQSSPDVYLDAPRLAFFLPVPGPLDLAVTMDSGQVFRWQFHAGGYWGVIGEYAYRLSQEEGGLRVLSSASSEAAAVAALGAFLRLEDDYAGLCRELAQDRPLGQAIARYPGLRLLRQDPWECLASFICSQVSNIPRISQNLRAIAHAFGQPVTLDGHTLYQFPSAGRLAQAGEGALFQLGLGFRATYLAAAAETVAAGRLDLAALRNAPYQEAKEALLEIKGIGEKVADCALVFSLDKLEAFPLDRWVRRAVAGWYGQPESARYADVLAWAQARWGQQCGYVQQFLFHYRRLLG